MAYRLTFPDLWESQTKNRCFFADEFALYARARDSRARGKKYSIFSYSTPRLINRKPVVDAHLTSMEPKLVFSFNVLRFYLESVDGHLSSFTESLESESISLENEGDTNMILFKRPPLFVAGRL